MTVVSRDFEDGDSPLVMTADSFAGLYRASQWSLYEVDPEWARFCEFGPEDIGSVWEDLGIIRKRPRVDHLYISEELMARVKEADKSIAESLTRPIDTLYGVPVTVMPQDILQGTVLVQHDIEMQHMKYLPKYILKGGSCD